jgi:hypothetical protein
MARMAEADVAPVELDPAPFEALVGKDVFRLTQHLAPTKILSRIHKALDHYTKAQRLAGVDDEMGAIRCIAAEEELVVAIFEWLKLNTDKVPEHRDFIGRSKNHRVKLAFLPVISNCGLPSATCWWTASRSTGSRTRCTGRCRRSAWTER